MRFVFFCLCFFSFNLFAHLLPCEGELKISQERGVLKLIIPQRERESFPELFPQKGEARIKAFAEKNFTLKLDGIIHYPQLIKHEIENKDLSRPSFKESAFSQEEIHQFDHFTFSYEFSQLPSKIEIIPPGHHDDPYLFGPQYFRFQVALSEGAFQEKFFLQQETFLIPNWYDSSKTKLYVLDEEDEQVSPDRYFGNSQTAHAYLYLQKHNARIEFLFPYDSFTHQLKEANQKPRLDFEIDEQEKARNIIRKILQEKLSLALNEKLTTPSKLEIKFIDFNANTLSHQETQQRLERHNTLIAVSSYYQSLNPIENLSVKWLHESARVPDLQWSVFPRNTEKIRQAFKGEPSEISYQIPQEMKEKRILLAPTNLKNDLDENIYFTLIVLAVLMLLFCAITRKKHHFIAMILMLIVLSRMAYLVREKYLTRLAEQCSAYETILKQIYHAQELYEEVAIYRHLEKVAEKDLLGKLYLLVREEQKQKKNNTIFSKIRSVKLTSSKVLDAGFDQRGDFTFTAKIHWEIDAALEHWGHSHQKKQSYTGQVTLIAREGKWKLNQFKLQQVDH